MSRCGSSNDSDATTATAAATEPPDVNLDIEPKHQQKNDDGNTSIINNTCTLTKAQRGRWKKLRKKAFLNVSKNNQSSSFTGICRWSDLEELESITSVMQPLKTTDVRDMSLPRINFRFLHSKEEQKEERMISLTDHRDLILNLLLMDGITGNAPSIKQPKKGGVGTKRTRESDANGGGITDIDSDLPLLLQPRILPPMPSWVSVHNPISISRAAILLFSIEGDESDCSVGIDSASCTFFSNELSERSLNVPKTRIFQGNRPRDISEVLFFMERSRASVNKLDEMKASSSTKTQERFNLDALSKQPQLPEYYLQFWRLCHTLEQMKEEGYPMNHLLPVSQGSDHENISASKSDDDSYDFISTNSTRSFRREVPQIFAVDCEMVLTKSGHSLARVTLLAFKHDSEDEESNFCVEMDCLVKPNEPVLDYLTQYSGIKASDLVNVTTTLNDIQRLFVKKVHFDDIIIGHSLENDLNALKISHGRVVDTALLFCGHDNRKHSLRHLSRVLLRRKIQENQSGHCSIEDAHASLLLAARRAKLGPSFRLKSKSDNQINILQALEDVSVNSPENQAYPLTRCSKASLAFVGNNEWIKKYATRRSHALTCESVKDDNSKAIKSWIVSKSRKPSLLVSNLNAKNLAEIKSFVSSIYNSAPTSTAIFVAVQKGFVQAQKMEKTKRTLQDPRASLMWTDEMQKKFDNTLDQSRFPVATYWLCPEPVKS